MPLGFLYLVVIMDWFSRCVLAWELSNSLDAEFCISALSHALLSNTLERHNAPEIFNP
jgi:putative transposase